MNYLKLFFGVWREGKIETAHRVKQRCGQIFIYAVRTGRAEQIRRVIRRREGASSTNHSAITEPVEIAAIMKAIDGFKGQLLPGARLSFHPCCLFGQENYAAPSGARSISRKLFGVSPPKK